MAPKPIEALTDYEQQRLDNIRRNGEMMSALLLHRKASDLSSINTKPPKKFKPCPKKPQAPVIIRRSLRTRGIPPSDDASAAGSHAAPSPPSSPPRKRGPLLIRDAFASGPHNSDAGLIAAISNSTPPSDYAPVKKEGFDPRLKLTLKTDNIARIVADRILSVRFLPFADRAIVAVGNKIGNLGFWDVSASSDDGDKIYVYEPHSRAISDISSHPFSPTKIYTSSYDGFVRVMDVENEAFNAIISSDDLFYSICQWPQDVNLIFVGEGGGMLKVWDKRAGKESSFWELHESRINTIDFNSENANLMTTSSSDGLACIWDLRCMKKDKPESVNLIRHGKAVQSAYFSPTGIYLATTRSVYRGSSVICFVCLFFLNATS